MDAEELAARIDHTVLGPETTVADVETVVEEAAAYGMNVCVPPCYVTEAVDHAAAVADDGAAPVAVVTVVGFPHGQHAQGVKATEAETAADAGAGELDVVINVGRLQGGEDAAVREELSDVVAAVDVPVKVIVETALLSDEELERACECAEEAGADYVKTSTGFADGGARVEDVEVMAHYLPVKASGGIGSWADAQAMFDAGADRIGASSGVEIMEDFLAAE